jgi:DUF177 domain-containing protein
LESFPFDKPEGETYHTAPMSGALGEYLDLTRAGHQPVRQAGSVKLAALPRLAAAVADSGGLATAELQVDSAGGRVRVQGWVQANLVLSCQRCFGKLDFPVKADINLVWVRSDAEAQNLPEGYEPLLSASGKVKFADLIEDELLLALPMAALHTPPQACKADARIRPLQASAAGKPGRSGAFAALKTLKRH